MKPYTAHFEIRPAAPVPGWGNPDGMYGPREWLSVDTDDPEAAKQEWLKTNSRFEHRLVGVTIKPAEPVDSFGEGLRKSARDWLNR